MGLLHQEMNYKTTSASRPLLGSCLTVLSTNYEQAAAKIAGLPVHLT